MKTTTKLRILFLFTWSLSFNCFARHGGTEGYFTSFGIRGGPLYGLSLKHFIVPRNAFELILGSEWKGVSFTALYEYEREFLSVNSLYWFIGAGVNYGEYPMEFYYASKQYAGNTTLVGAGGVDAIAGLEWRVRVIPITLSLDFKPFVTAINPSQTLNYDYALTLRYIFK